MRKLRILLVENHKKWRKRLATHIHKVLPNAELESASNYPDAAGQLQRGPWDLFVTDLGLPPDIGHILGKQLVEEADKNKVPCIVVSGTVAVTKEDVRDILMIDHVLDFFSKDTLGSDLKMQRRFQRLVRLAVSAVELPQASRSKRLTDIGSVTENGSPGFQRIIGANNLKQVAWMELGLQASRAVCRVLTPNGLGTGFLIGTSTLITNHHVIPSKETAKQTKAEFNYQYSFNANDKPSGAVRYELDPASLFRTSIELDYTVVAVSRPSEPETPSVNSWGALQLNPDADPVPTDYVMIVQHPNGAPKQIALTANSVLQIKRPFLHYATDTMQGSSGSPVFNDMWHVIAIHHAAGPPVTNRGTRHSNEGILMSEIRTDMGDAWLSWAT